MQTVKSQVDQITSALAKQEADRKAIVKEQTKTEDDCSKRFNVLKVDKQYIGPKGYIKSPIIRKLLSEGFSRGQVSKAMNIIYQHVRNVDITPLVHK